MAFRVADKSSCLPRAFVGSIPLIQLIIKKRWKINETKTEEKKNKQRKK